MAAIPEEVIEEILSRLPVKSLLRFKTVSKNWYSLISQNHTFHLKQSSSSSASKNLIFFQMPEDGTIFQSSDLDTLQSRKIKFSMSNCRIIGSANGLICLAKKNQSRSSIGDCSCFLWNPSTSQHKCISIPVLDTDQCTLYGFGYDSVCDDYKIIGDWVSHIRLFSLRTSSWKILEYSFIYPSRSPAFYLNGALHWCVGPHITAFDLANVTIFDLELPDEISRYTWVPVFGYQGYLCVCGHRSVWMMKEYGNISSWTKLGTSISGDYDFAVGISIFGEVVFCTHDELLYVQSGRLCSDYKPQRIHFGDAFVYKESLISLKGFDPERR